MSSSNRPKTQSQTLKTILLVEEKHAGWLTTKWFLSYLGYTVDSASTREEALVRFDPQVHDIIVTGDFMWGMTGEQMANRIKACSPSTPVLLYTKAPPESSPALDMIIRSPAHLLALKDAVDTLLSNRK